MKLRIALLILLAALVLAAPAAAAPPAPVGERICLMPYCGGTESQTFPQGQPFYIAHGWIDRPGNYPMGLWDFELEVDGQPRPEDFVQRSVDTAARPPNMTLSWVHNFPEGMTGTHAFTGTWLATCQFLVDQGRIPGPCANPNEIMPYTVKTIYVTFVQP